MKSFYLFFVYLLISLATDVGFARSSEIVSSLGDRANPSDIALSKDTSPELIAFDNKPTNSIQSLRYQEVVTAVENFLALLEPQQREAVLLPFAHPYRTRGFCYVLARCKEDSVGLRMSQLNSRQKIALNNLLMKSYSSAGYSRAIQTMNREGLLEEMENAHRDNPDKYRVVGSPQVTDWTPPPFRRSSDFYVAIFGQPDRNSVLFGNPWGIRFEGHHLSLNLTYDRTSTRPQVNALPMFFGSSPAIVPQSPTLEEGRYSQWQTQEGQQLLHREAWLARSFLHSLDSEAISLGAWSALPDVDLLGGTEVFLDAASYLDGEKPGILVSELTPLQRRLLWDFASEFWLMQGNGESIDEYAFKQSIESSRVWWYGDRKDEHGELYFRVQGERYLIELLQSNTFGVVSEDVKANHIHASFRDLENDWDRNVLGEHLESHDN